MVSPCAVARARKRSWCSPVTSATAPGVAARWSAAVSGAPSTVSVPSKNTRLGSENPADAVAGSPVPMLRSTAAARRGESARSVRAGRWCGAPVVRLSSWRRRGPTLRFAYLLVRPAKSTSSAMRRSAPSVTRATRTARSVRPVVRAGWESVRGVHHAPCSRGGTRLRSYCRAAVGDA